MTQKHKNIFVFTLVALLFFPFVMPVVAQETTSEEALAQEQQEKETEETVVEIDTVEPVIDIVEPTIEEITTVDTEAIEIEENKDTDQTISDEITYQDLDIKESKMLPDHPFYFLKNWGRATRLFFTTSPLNRAELRLRYSNEKLIEIKELSQNEEVNDDKQAPKIKKIINRSLDKWGEEQEKIKIEQLVTNEPTELDKPENDKFIQKYIDHNLKQELILQKLEDQLPIEIFEKVREKRECHLEKFSQVMEKVEEKHQTAKKYFEQAIENIPANLPDQQLRVLEIVKNIEENAVQIKPFLKKIKQEKIQEVKTKLINIPPKERVKKIEQFFSQSVIDPIEKMEIIKEVKVIMPAMRTILTNSREKIIVDFGKKIEEIPSIEAKEKFLEGIAGYREKHIEVLNEIQAKLENKLPEDSRALQMIQNVIERQEEKIETWKEEGIETQQERRIEIRKKEGIETRQEKRIEDRQEERVRTMDQKGIDESVERPMPPTLDIQTTKPSLGERLLRLKTQLRTKLQTNENDTSEEPSIPGTITIEERKPIDKEPIEIKPIETKTEIAPKTEAGKDINN